MPTTRKPKPDLRLMFRFAEHGDSFNGRYLIFTAEAATMTPDGVRYNYLGEPGGEYTGLSVRAQLDQTSTCGLYGYKAEFRSDNGLDLRTLRSMASTLATVERRLAVLSDRFGYPVDLATFMGHLADAIGVTTKYCFGRHIGRGESDITGTGYRWLETSYLRDHIATTITEWRTKHGIVPAA